MVNRPPMGRIGRIHTDLIRADPSDPPNRWSIKPSEASSTDLGHLSFHNPQDNQTPIKGYKASR